MENKDKVRVQKEYFKNGNLKSETPYLNGKPNGLQKEYYESGKLNFETPYIEGRIHGILKGYWENGTLQKEIPYVKGYINGVSKKYDNEIGSVIEEYTYNKNKLNGLAIEMHPDGEIISERLYECGELISHKEYKSNLEEDLKSEGLQ